MGEILNLTTELLNHLGWTPYFQEERNYVENLHWNLKNIQGLQNGSSHKQRKQPEGNYQNLWKSIPELKGSKKALSTFWQTS